MPSAARDTGTQLVHFLRKTVNFANLATSTLAPAVDNNLEIGTIPANAVVTGDGIYISTLPDGTTNVLDIGYTSDSLSTMDIDAYASALSLPITTGLGRVALDELGNVSGTSKKRTVDTTLIAQRRGTATTGILDIVIQYVLDK